MKKILSLFISCLLSFSFSLVGVRGYSTYASTYNNDVIPKQKEHTIFIGSTFVHNQQVQSHVLHHHDLFPLEKITGKCVRTFPPTFKISKEEALQLKKLEQRSCALTQQKIISLIQAGNIHGLRTYKETLQDLLFGQKPQIQEIIRKEIALVDRHLQDKHIDVLEQLKNESSLDRAYALMQKTLSEPVSVDVIEAMQRIWTEKEGYLQYAMTHGEKDPEVEPKTTSPELQSSISEIRTAVFPEYDLNNPLDQHYNALLEIIKIDHPESFGEYQSALTPILKEIQIKVEKGDFASPKEAMVYALQNYFHHLQPTNPLKEPHTFIINTAKYVGWAVINMAAGNVLAPVQKAGLVLSILQELNNFDYSNLNPKEQIDAICQQAAEITWMIVSDQMVKKLPKAKSYFKKRVDAQLKPAVKSIAIERPAVIAHTPEGVPIEMPHQGNETSLLNADNQKLPKNTVIETVKANLTIPQIGEKLKYVFGKATGSLHNIERSTGMAKQLNSIGIFDNSTGNSYLKNHLTEVLNNPSNILKMQTNGRVIRESLLMGPKGGLKMHSIWEESKLITIELFG